MGTGRWAGVATFIGMCRESQQNSSSSGGDTAHSPASRDGGRSANIDGPLPGRRRRCPARLGPVTPLNTRRWLPGNPLDTRRRLTGNTLDTRRRLPGNPLDTRHWLPGNTLNTRCRLPGNPLDTGHWLPGNPRDAGIRHMRVNSAPLFLSTYL